MPALLQAIQNQFRKMLVIGAISAAVLLIFVVWLWLFLISVKP